MSGTMRVWIKAGERIYVNGAVLRFDRKTSLEFLNDVQFLLEKQVLQACEARTPVRRLYFRVQQALMSADQSRSTTLSIAAQWETILQSCNCPAMHEGDAAMRATIEAGRYHEVMKRLRAFFKHDDTSKAARAPVPTSQVKEAI